MIPRKHRGLFTRLASSRNGMAVYEVDDSYAGMMAVRGLADEAFGKSWDDGAWIRSPEHDDMMLDSYWDWIGCDEPRKILLLKDGRLAGFSYLTYFCKMRGIEWYGLSANPSRPRYQIGYGGGPSWLDARKSRVLDRFNGILTSDDIMLECHDVFIVNSWNDFISAAESNNPNTRRIAASHHLPSIGEYTDDAAEVIGRLASDPDWRVRRAAAMNDDVPDRMFERLAGDVDWRVRRGCCQCLFAINPWAKGNASSRRAEIIAGLLDDPEFEVMIAAVEFALHAPPEIRSSVSGRLLSLGDERVREAVTVKLLSQ